MQTFCADSLWAMFSIRQIGVKSQHANPCIGDSMWKQEPIYAGEERKKRQNKMRCDMMWHWYELGKRTRWTEIITVIMMINIQRINLSQRRHNTRSKGNGCWFTKKFFCYRNAFFRRKRDEFLPWGCDRKGIYSKQRRNNVLNKVECINDDKMFWYP